MILKYLGIILLCVLGLLFLVLLTVLLIPIRYRLFLSSKEEERIRVEGRITWAVIPLRINGTLVGKAYRFWIRSFGMYLYDSDFPLSHRRNTVARFLLKRLGFDPTDGVETERERKLREVKDKFSRKKEKEQSEDTLSDDPVEEDSFDDAPSEDTGEEKPSFSEYEDLSEEDSSSLDQEDPFGEEPPKKDIYDHVMYFFDRLNDGISTAEKKLEEFSETCSRTWNLVIEKVREVIARIKALIRTIRFVLRVLEQDSTHKLLKIWIRNLWKIFCHVLPTKCEGFVHFGFPDDPEKMGKILAFCGAAYSLYGKSIRVIPDFSEKVIEGELLIKGRIRLITLGFRVFRMLINFTMVKVLWFIYKEKTGKNDPRRKRKRRRKKKKTSVGADVRVGS